MCCPRDIICHGLSLCIAMLPASCFITPHLLTAFSLWQKHLLKLQRSTIMDTVSPTVGRESEKLCSNAKRLAWLLTPLATSCVVLLCPSTAKQSTVRHEIRGDSKASGHPSLTSVWKADKTTGTTLLAFETRVLVVRQNKPPPSIEHIKTADSATIQLAADKEQH